MRSDKKHLSGEYQRLLAAVSAVLFRCDPVGINFEENGDEYDPEAETILPRLRECHSVADVSRIVREEFVRWFDEDLAGGEERYEEVAREIWTLWRDHQNGLSERHKVEGGIDA